MYRNLLEPIALGSGLSSHLGLGEVPLEGSQEVACQHTWERLAVQLPATSSFRSRSQSGFTSQSLMQLADRGCCTWKYERHDHFTAGTSQIQALEGLERQVWPCSRCLPSTEAVTERLTPQLYGQIPACTMLMSVQPMAASSPNPAAQSGRGRRATPSCSFVVCRRLRAKLAYNATTPKYRNSLQPHMPMSSRVGSKEPSGACDFKTACWKMYMVTQNNLRLGTVIPGSNTQLAMCLLTTPLPPPPLFLGYANGISGLWLPRGPINSNVPDS